MRFGVVTHPLLVVFMCAVGCSTPPVVEEQFHTEPKARIETGGRGIAIRRFKVLPSTEAVKEKLNGFGHPLPNAALQDRFESEGVIVRIIESVDVPAIAASLGDTQNMRFDWHGQIMQWRDVQQRHMPRNGMLVTVSGVSHFVDHGYLTLLARGWQMGMEQGDQMYLQLLPVWHVPAERGIVPGRDIAPTESRVFSELILECLLDDGQALLMVTYMEPQKLLTGPVDGGPAAVRLGEALMGGPVDESVLVFLVFEAHVG